MASGNCGAGPLPPSGKLHKGSGPAADVTTMSHSVAEVDHIVQGVIGKVLGEQRYSPNLVDAWCDQILETSLTQIASLGRPFKYIGTCVISEQGSGTLDTAATAFWDTQSDCLCCTRRGTGGMVDCIVTIYSCRR